MPFFTHCSSQRNWCRWALVVGSSIWSRSSSRWGSYLILSANTMRPRHRNEVESRMYFEGSSFMSFQTYSPSNWRIDLMSLGAVQLCNSISCSRCRKCNVRPIGSISERGACRCVTTLVLPCITRVGEYIPSDEIKDCGACDAPFSLSFQ